jgi:hypothetical protein
MCIADPTRLAATGSLTTRGKEHRQALFDELQDPDASECIVFTPALAANNLTLLRAQDMLRPCFSLTNATRHMAHFPWNTKIIFSRTLLPEVDPHALIS